MAGKEWRRAETTIGDSLRAGAVAVGDSLRGMGRADGDNRPLVLAARRNLLRLGAADGDSLLGAGAKHLVAE